MTLINSKLTLQNPRIVDNIQEILYLDGFRFWFDTRFMHPDIDTCMRKKTQSITISTKTYFSEF
jgi:hypothetical protein